MKTLAAVLVVLLIIAFLFFARWVCKLIDKKFDDQPFFDDDMRRP